MPKNVIKQKNFDYEYLMELIKLYTNISDFSMLVNCKELYIRSNVKKLNLSF